MDRACSVGCGVLLYHTLFTNKNAYIFTFISALLCGFFLLTEFPERESETGEAETGVGSPGLDKDLEI